MVLFKNLRFLSVIIGLVINIGCLVTRFEELPVNTNSYHQFALAYSFYKYGTLSSIHEQIEQQVQKVIPLKTYDVPEKPTVNDTVGYAALVGILWKITGSLNLLDVQILQIALFCLMIFLIFQIFLLLFDNNKNIAFLGCLILDCWYYLIFLNVIAGRDIWGFYGGVVLCYVLLKSFLIADYSFSKIALASVFFAFCQFLRPNIFGQLLTLSAVFLFLVFLYKREIFARAIRVIGLVVGINILFFWVPFVSYNKIVYGRYFVGPLGHGLLAALSSVENPWGLKMNDGDIVAHVAHSQAIDSLDYGKPVVADASLSEFKRLFSENPLIYCKALLLSVKKSFLYELIKWEGRIDSFSEKMRLTFSLTWAGCFFRLLGVFGDMVRLFVWPGLILVLYRKKMIPFIFLIGGVVLGMWMLWLSHFEERYVVPFAWPLAVFASYFLVSCFELIRNYYFKKKSKKMKKQVAL